MYAPTTVHLEAAYKILRYLKKYLGLGLFNKAMGVFSIEAYSDADYVGSLTNRRSTSGSVPFFGRHLVTWKSKKQLVVACSSAKAEFRSMVHSICELLWICRMLAELGCVIPAPM